ncbi:methyltransferase domain-containing protein, partial [bacterium]|nr:methyltransferase domain-containing protein [bacterium]
ARAGNYANVEFRTAEIKELPLADGSVDVVISNCVLKGRIVSLQVKALKTGKTMA